MRAGSHKISAACLWTDGCLQYDFNRGEIVKGVRFERLGTGRYYNVILHVGSTYVPVSDETVAELKTQTLLSPDRFLELLIQKTGYSSYLKEQIRNELKKAGDPVTQITVLQGAIRDL
jgi:hypothetical protein